MRYLVLVLVLGWGCSEGDWGVEYCPEIHQGVGISGAPHPCLEEVKNR